MIEFIFRLPFAYDSRSFHSSVVEHTMPPGLTEFLNEHHGRMELALTDYYYRQRGFIVRFMTDDPQIETVFRLKFG